ncbi:hypothetical protein IWX65_003204 [Arthrobacter sp. CAN_A214]|uniref:hypothetical protein n=1 Tax=Arthrobacter sp. CAN_A214 TaxID=2787720 RepID=UPI0018C9DB90
MSALFLALLVGVCPACTAERPSIDGLPSYSSLEDARQAVAGHLDCEENPPLPTAIMGDEGQIPAESVKCTQSVKIFYFESTEARDNAYAVMADAAEPDGSVYFAEGKNWFVVDYSDVGVGTGDPENPWTSQPCRNRSVPATPT